MLWMALVILALIVLISRVEIYRHRKYIMNMESRVKKIEARLLMPNRWS